MPLSALNHRYFGQKSLVAYTKSDLLAGLLSHLQSSSYADATLRSAGPSAWSWVTKDSGAAILGTPAVNTIGHRVVIATTGGSQPSGVVFRNGFTANSIIIGLAKNTGNTPTYSSWDNAGSPFNTGSFSGYITVTPDITGIGTITSFKWLAWESQQTVWIQCFYTVQNLGGVTSKLMFAGGGIDPQTGDSVDAESDEAQYTIFATGTDSYVQSDMLSSVTDPNCILTSSVTNNRSRWLSFSPGTSNLMHCMRIFNIPTDMNSLSMTSRTGKYPRIPIYLANCNDINSYLISTSWGGKLREVFHTKHSLSGQALIDGGSVSGYTIAPNLSGSQEDCIFLKY